MGCEHRSSSVNKAKVQEYVISEYQCERFELEDGAAWPLGFMLHKLKDLCWSLMRLGGFGYVHVHEGAKSSRGILANARRNLHLFPTAVAAGSCAAPGRRLLIDATDTLCRGFTTGVQRVVRELMKAAEETGSGIPVFVLNGSLFSYLRARSSPQEIEIARGDKFIMADVTWRDVPIYRAAMQRVSDKGGYNVLVLHDMMPLSCPVLFPTDFYPRTAKQQANWFDNIVVNSDAVVTVSKCVAGDFLAYLAANKKPINANLRLGWSHLGADFETAANQPLSARAASICANATPFFLSVGSLEPRKGVRIVLEAMDRLWEEGIDVAYVIAGAYRYCARALVAHIVSHPEYGRRLFWLDDVSNADLCHLYKNARGLIFASVVEGFGLPLVEAAYFGLPAIASDIPVFREIGGGAITYFDVADATSLAARIREALAAPKCVNAMPFLTWREAAGNLLHMISDETYQFGPVEKLVP
jgi:glycosyltransferase involved in cell wall biosynthesis